MTAFTSSLHPSESQIWLHQLFKPHPVPCPIRLVDRSQGYTSSPIISLSQGWPCSNEVTFVPGQEKSTCGLEPGRRGEDQANQERVGRRPRRQTSLLRGADTAGLGSTHAGLESAKRFFRNIYFGMSLVIQWLRLHVPNARGIGSSQK